MYTFVVLGAVGLGLLLVGLAAYGVVRGAFPFRPRRGWDQPPPGAQQSGPRRVSRADEPELFWWIAGLLALFGTVNVAVGVLIAIRGPDRLR